MLITGTIQEWAKQHADRLKQSREVESKIAVGRVAGAFPSQHAKDLRMTQINSQLAAYEMVAGLVVVDEVPECDFCGDPATQVEQWDGPIPVCDACSAGVDESGRSSQL